MESNRNVLMTFFLCLERDLFSLEAIIMIQTVMSMTCIHLFPKSKPSSFRIFHLTLRGHPSSLPAPFISPSAKYLSKPPPRPGALIPSKAQITGYLEAQNILQGSPKILRTAFALNLLPFHFSSISCIYNHYQGSFYFRFRFLN